MIVVWILLFGLNLGLGISNASNGSPILAGLNFAAAALCGFNTFTTLVAGLPV